MGERAGDGHVVIGLLVFDGEHGVFIDLPMLLYGSGDDVLEDVQYILFSFIAGHSHFLYSLMHYSCPRYYRLNLVVDYQQLASARIY